MAIKMRNNKDLDSVCCECGHHRSDVLDMFDLCVGGNVFTICDECNEQLLHKTLKAECYKNGRTKTQQDMKVMRKRADGSYKSRWYLKQEEAKRKGDAHEGK